VAWQSFDIGNSDTRALRGFVLIGQLVRRRRERLGLSQRQLELLTGIDQSVISRLENGRLAGLRWSRFARLVEAIGGLAEADPQPAWTTRFLPQAGGFHDLDGHD
jgi:transcriptional regulator with XRE-family HTH domain